MSKVKLALDMIRRHPKAGAVVIAAAGLAVPAEGVVTKVYADPIGIPTACIGRVVRGMQLGTPVPMGTCVDWAVEDLGKAYAGIKRCIRAELSINEWASYTSLALNVGAHAVCKSSIPRKIAAGARATACLTVKDFNKVRVMGVLVPLPGLTTRRGIESDHCVEGLR